MRKIKLEILQGFDEYENANLQLFLAGKLSLKDCAENLHIAKHQRLNVFYGLTVEDVQKSRYSV